MDVAAALARLEAAGTEQNRKVYRRHGAQEPLFGVSFAALKALAKGARPDGALALAAKVPGVRERADRWSASTRDWTAQAGWDLYGQLALHDSNLDEASFVELLERIEAGIAGAGNRTRHSMNGALIAIGMRSPALRAAAEAAAGRIGPVRVDHGRTGCVTPPAVPYIAKSWDRRTAKGGAAGVAR